MYERFTDRARRVVRVAYGPRSQRRPEATEAEVVAALLGCGGVAAEMLRDSGIGVGSLAGSSLPVECRAFAKSANEEAWRAGMNYVGTEHILLALARTPGSGLPAAGATPEALEARLGDIYARSAGPMPPELAALHAECVALLRRARRALRRNPFRRTPPEGTQ